MKKTKIFITIIICILMCISLLACNKAEKINDDRFITIKEYNNGYYVVVDKHTGVKYIYRAYYNAFGISPLYDENGNVEIMSEEELQELISNLQSSKN